MAAIKGQNVRLFLGDKCVAASTSCQLHIAAQIESKTTKDSPDGFDENGCTGKSWDASIDALVIEREITVVSENNTITWNGINSEEYTLAQGEGITIRAIQGSSSTKAIVKVNGTQVGQAYAGKPFTYFNYTNQSQTVLLTKSASAGDYQFFRYDRKTISDASALTADDLLSKLGNERLQLKFAITTGTDHRTSSQVLKQGYCYLTDLSITAGNKQNSTFSAQLTGDGELETPSA